MLRSKSTAPLGRRLTVKVVLQEKFISLVGNWIAVDVEPLFLSFKWHVDLLTLWVGFDGLVCLVRVETLQSQNCLYAHQRHCVGESISQCG